MGFIAAALILAMVVLVLLSFPWWRPGRRRSVSPLSAEDLTAELGEDVAAGTLAAEDLEPASRDLKATADDAEPSPQRSELRRRWNWSVAALLLVPLAAGVLYWHFGNWRAGIEGERAATLHRADTLFARLQAHQRRHPEDVQGWIDLGQGADALGRYDLAVQAYGRAVKLTAKPDAELLGLWGEAQLLADPHKVTPEEQQIFARVLKLDPDNARGLWYGGLIAFSTGNRAEVLKDWRRLLARPDVPPQVAAIVRSHLAALGEPATAGKAAAAAAASLSVTVSMSPSLAAKVKPGETLYVFVRKPTGGPPYAVRRLQVEQFPVTVTLDDADAMLAGRNLSSMSRNTVEVGAFLSASGDAAPRAGDLLGSTQIELQGDAQTVSLEIDRVAGKDAGKSRGR